MKRDEEYLFVADGSTRAGSSGIGISISRGSDAQVFREVSEWLPRFDSLTAEMIALLRAVQLADETLLANKSCHAVIFSDCMSALESVWAGRKVTQLEPIAAKALAKILQIIKSGKSIVLKYRQRVHQSEADALARNGSNLNGRAILECALVTTGLLSPDMILESVQWSAILLRAKRSEQIYAALAQTPQVLMVSLEEARGVLLKESQWDPNVVRATAIQVRHSIGDLHQWCREFISAARHGPASTIWWLEYLLYQMRMVAHGFVIETSAVLEIGQPRQISYELNLTHAEAELLLRAVQLFAYHAAEGFEEILGAEFCLQLARMGYLEPQEQSVEGQSGRMRLHRELFACTEVRLHDEQPAVRVNLARFRSKPPSETWDQVLSSSLGEKREALERATAVAVEAERKVEQRKQHNAAAALKKRHIEENGVWSLHFSVEEAEALLALEASDHGLPREEATRLLGDVVFKALFSSQHLVEVEDERVVVNFDSLQTAFCFVYPPFGHTVPSVRAKKVPPIPKPTRSWNTRLSIAVKRTRARMLEISAEVPKDNSAELIDAVCGCGLVLHGTRAVFAKTQVNCNTCGQPFAPAEVVSTVVVATPTRTEIPTPKQVPPKATAGIDDPKVKLQLRLLMTEAEALVVAYTAKPEEIEGLLGSRLFKQLSKEGYITQDNGSIRLERKKFGITSFCILDPDPDDHFRYRFAEQQGNPADAGPAKNWIERLQSNIHKARKRHLALPDKPSRLLRVTMRFVLSLSQAKAVLKLVEQSPIVPEDMEVCLGKELCALFQRLEYIRYFGVYDYAFKLTKWVVVRDAEYDAHAEPWSVLTDGPDVTETQWLGDLRRQVAELETKPSLAKRSPRWMTDLSVPMEIRACVLWTWSGGEPFKLRGNNSLPTHYCGLSDRDAFKKFVSRLTKWSKKPTGERVLTSHLANGWTDATYQWVCNPFEITSENLLDIYGVERPL